MGQFKKFLRGVLSVLLLGIAWQAAPNAFAAPAEMTKAQQWTKAAFNSGTITPFSFNYGGQPADLGHWKRQRSARKLDNQRVQTTLTWDGPAKPI